MAKVRVTRSLSIPDPLVVSRCRKIPELGPRVLFFSGGSALTGLSRTLKNYTHNSIHLVTPFDSGGSSAKLRAAFAMPAIGDLRSRLMALADETVLGHPEISGLFTYRLPIDQPRDRLLDRLQQMVAGKDPLVAAILNPMRRLICNNLGYFLDAMPEDFDLSGASIGNLILAGGYINNHRDLEPILFLFSKLVNVQGTVRAIVDDDLHLRAVLEDDSLVVGQHRLTGKEMPRLAAPIRTLGLCNSATDPTEATVQVRGRNRDLIEEADLICYPQGSFYSSLIANLLPDGVGRSISRNDCPKVFIPNQGSDPEQLGMTLADSITTLVDYLKRDDVENLQVSDLLNFIIVDSASGQYPGGIPYPLLDSLGIQVIDLDLIHSSADGYYDNERLVAALLSLSR
ncbi:GAK system CofD-like protein [Marinobacterium sp. D7]|uniref:GAK system CofD-like protein n=1 Tax=Marinobacterium ramblicola TaxID=2849041 RepID=UPI001C2D2767|nr:GAK system CofD-like protein [Marinobacterium ramblicola]MBV1788106.1 GAK system CofD-like protein [Marinobacterium ramblicola]